MRDSLLHLRPRYRKFFYLPRKGLNGRHAIKRTRCSRFIFFQRHCHLKCCNARSLNTLRRGTRLGITPFPMAVLTLLNSSPQHQNGISLSLAALSIFPFMYSAIRTTCVRVSLIPLSSASLIDHTIVSISSNELRSKVKFKQVSWLNPKFLQPSANTFRITVIRGSFVGDVFISLLLMTQSYAPFPDAASNLRSQGL